MLKRLHNNPQLAQAPNDDTPKIKMSNTMKPSHRRRKETGNRYRNSDRHPKKTETSPMPKITPVTYQDTLPKAPKPPLEIRKEAGQYHADDHTNKISKLKQTNRKLRDEIGTLKLQLSEKSAELINEQVVHLESRVEKLETKLELNAANDKIKEQTEIIAELNKKIWKQRPM